MEYNNGRRSSNASSSSSSDFYGTPDRQTPKHVAVPPDRAYVPASSPTMQRGASAVNTPDHHDADDEGDSDAMDLSTDSSNSGSPQSQPQPTLHVGIKRKAIELGEEDVRSDDTAEEAAAKKPKLSNSQAYVVASTTGPFPEEIWQQVFLHLPPVMLGRCLSVCRKFHLYLTQVKVSPSASKNKGSASSKDSEAIWAHSRKTFYPSLPKPLSRCSELRMLQLVGGHTCESCHRKLPRLLATDPFHCGPGVGGLRTVWPFAIRTCGRCLESNSFKDIDILKSNSSAKELRFGLPYVFLTVELHVIPASQRQQPGGIPANYRASKIYYTRDIARISAEFENARSLGDGAAEEWRKGLHDKGQSALNDASRWERWEATITASGKNITQVLREYDVSSFPRNPMQGQMWSAGGLLNGTQLPPAEVAYGSSAPHHPAIPFQNGYSDGYIYGPPPSLANPMHLQLHQPARDVNDFQAIRDIRQRDIERRCMELEPPVEPAVLQHCPAYQSALQIGQPMTDAAWTVLKPRILAQREAAELAEHQRQERIAALAAGISAPGDMDYTKSSKDRRDKEYEAVQSALRKRLGEYAKEAIKLKWNGAHHLDKDNCTAFAVDVVLHVRKKYLEDMATDTLPPVPLPKGSDQGTPIPDPFLSLDNMKWVFENTIRPLTENLRRDLFVCAECTDEKRPKWFAFEGLLQHYGAKHTSAFSSGNVVVQWENSDWPDDPPFHTHPLQFIVPDRKPHGRMRSTPQANHHGPFNPPSSSRLLSENPLFASREPHSSNIAHDRHAVSAANYGYQRGALAHSHGGSVEPTIDMSEAALANKLAIDIREIWDALEGVKDLLDCVRLQAAIYFAVQRFVDKFHMFPSLDLFTDALASNTQVLPVKNANGLACQICVAERNPNYQSYYARIQNVKLYTISSLVTHFKLLHAHATWSIDMIELPEQQMIADLVSAPGMDDDKLATLAMAFPSAFPAPLPKIGLVPESTQEAGAGRELTSRILDRLNKKQKQQSKKKNAKVVNETNTPTRGSSSEPVPEPKEDEYDPRRPMYIANDDRMEEDDPARFDTDLRKTRHGPSALSSNDVQLPASLLTSINRFDDLRLQAQQALPTDDERERSPSVGRADSRNSTGKPMINMPATQPDISAILAALMPQLQPTQTETLPKSLSTHSDGAPKYSGVGPYGQLYSVPSATHHEDQRPAARYPVQPNHRAFVEYSPHYSDQRGPATADHNTQSFQHNQGRAYAEPAYSSAQSPQRYRYVYDEPNNNSHYVQQVQSTSIYREQPVQYIQQPAPEHFSPTTASIHYEQPSQPQPSRSVYVDAYGNRVQLVPADSAPASIQYIPHPFEQQQQQQQRQYYASPALPQASAPGSSSRAQPVYFDYGGAAPYQQLPYGPGQPHHGMY